jgi:polyisoprenyl-teichoic acid--peptidoglycan teichoic acid transferase
MLQRRRTGALILGVFVLAVVALAMIGFTVPKARLLENLLSTRVLIVAALACVVGGLAWIGVIVRTYTIGRPRNAGFAQQAVGLVAVVALCAVVATPLGYAANLANSQRSLLDTLFKGDTGGTAAAEAIGKPRLNILLVGSDAGPDRKGARTDTMMVASIDTRTARTTLFALPRNIGHARFPPGSPMAQKFPNGFYDANDPLSGNYILNAVYAYGLDYPDLAPPTPTPDRGLNLLHQTVSYMLGLQLDYYVEVNMAGFASIIDALGGLRMDVGPEPIPIGGITPTGKHVKPDGFIPPGVQQLSGQQALAFARSRTYSSDYERMGRQRCLLQQILVQKSPADVLTNFQSVATATTNSVSTNIPQQVLPGLAALGSEKTLSLESISFDPSLPDDDTSDGHFNTLDPNVPLMRKVVQDAINKPPAPASAPPTTSASPSTKSRSGSSSATPTPTPNGATPTSLAATCR